MLETKLNLTKREAGDNAFNPGLMHIKVNQTTVSVSDFSFIPKPHGMTWSYQEVKWVKNIFHTGFYPTVKPIQLSV